MPRKGDVVVAAAASGRRGMAPRRGRRTDRANETGARRRSRRRPEVRDRGGERADSSGSFRPRTRGRGRAGRGADLVRAALRRSPATRKALTASLAEAQDGTGEHVFEIDPRIRTLSDDATQLRLGVEGPPGRSWSSRTWPSCRLSRGLTAGHVSGSSPARRTSRPSS